MCYTKPQGQVHCSTAQEHKANKKMQLTNKTTFIEAIKKSH